MLALPVVDDAPVKLKQYKVLEVKSLLAKVTPCAETLVAVAPIPGHAVEPDGKLDVLVVQLPVVEEIVNPDGNATTTLFSTPAPLDEGFAQTVPDRAAFGFWEFSLR